MNRTEHFTHNGHLFEIRAAAFEEGWCAQAFLNGKTASRRFDARHEVADDHRSQKHGEMVDNLIAVVKGEIINDSLAEPQIPAVRHNA